MALASVRSNKMRSLLTMLGIIIGIAAVIAIVTVGNSMTGTVTDSMSGMGVSNITVSLTQKDSDDTSGTAQGVTLRRFMDSTPAADDLISQEMIDDFVADFPGQVNRIELSQEVGNGTIAKYGDPRAPMPTRCWPRRKTPPFWPGAGWTMRRTPGAMWPLYPKNLCSRPSAAATPMPSANPSR